MCLGTPSQLSGSGGAGSGAYTVCSPNPLAFMSNPALTHSAETLSVYLPAAPFNFKLLKSSGDGVPFFALPSNTVLVDV